MNEPRPSPLDDRHRAAGGRMVDFAGWLLPVQYSSVMDEHRAVRQAAGLFDVSHMGEIEVRGPQAEAAVQLLTPNDVASLQPGRAHYSALLTPEGTYVDDLLVYRLSGDEIMLVVNAANRDKDLAWIRQHLPSGLEVEVEDRSDSTALLALQGPRALEVLQPLTAAELSDLRYYRFVRSTVAGVQALVSRTGYTGEDGFELYVDPADAGALWDRLLEAGAPLGLVPAGLGARDTLRLEAAMALYGHEIDDATSPWEAGLDWTIKLEKGDFLGRDGLLRRREEGVRRQLVGFEVVDRGIARQGHPLLVDGTPAGAVTSGTFSPTLERAIGLGYVPTARSEAAPVAVEVRGRQLAVRLVPLPFYRRPRG